MMDGGCLIGVARCGHYLTYVHLVVRTLHGSYLGKIQHLIPFKIRTAEVYPVQSHLALVLGNNVAHRIHFSGALLCTENAPKI